MKPSHSNSRPIAIRIINASKLSTAALVLVTVLVVPGTRMTPLRGGAVTPGATVAEVAVSCPPGSVERTSRVTGGAVPLLTTSLLTTTVAVVVAPGNPGAVRTMVLTGPGRVTGGWIIVWVTWGGLIILVTVTGGILTVRGASVTSRVTVTPGSVTVGTSTQTGGRHTASGAAAAGLLVPYATAVTKPILIIRDSIIATARFMPQV